MLDFSGVWVPLVTPFREGAVDLPALKRLVAHLVQQGVAGFVACGSTGEAAMLDEREQAATLQATLQAASGQPVLMGLSGVQATAVARRAKALAADHPGLAGYLVTAPAYVKPSQTAVLQHFHTVANASPLPIVAYDIPARTGVRIEARTLLALAEHPRIRAVKDCSADPDAAHAVLADGRLDLLAGNDNEIFDQLARGARGVIAASSHVRTVDFVRLHALMRDGPGLADLPTARTLWRRLRPLVDALFAEPNPNVIKAVLARQGWLANELREPMLPAGAAATEQAMRLTATPPND